jgi:hypothetical protein
VRGKVRLLHLSAVESNDLEESHNSAGSAALAAWVNWGIYRFALTLHQEACERETMNHLVFPFNKSGAFLEIP